MPARKTKSVSRAIRTVSIPPALDRRMRAAGSVNWSAVAVSAFERELDRLSMSAVMLDTIKRMRLQNKEDQQETYEAGKEFGTGWAKRDARPKELRRLDRWRAEFGWGHDFHHSEIDARNLVAAIHGADDDNFDRDDVASFFEGGEHEDDEWLHGFVDGALEVWAAIAPQL